MAEGLAHILHLTQCTCIFNTTKWVDNLIVRVKAAKWVCVRKPVSPSSSDSYLAMYAWVVMDGVTVNTDSFSAGMSPWGHVSTSCQPRK